MAMLTSHKLTRSLLWGIIVGILLILACFVFQDLFSVLSAYIALFVIGPPGLVGLLVDSKLMVSIGILIYSVLLSVSFKFIPKGLRVWAICLIIASHLFSAILVVNTTNSRLKPLGNAFGIFFQKALTKK